MNDIEPRIPAWLAALGFGVPHYNSAVKSSRKSKHAGGHKKQKPATHTKQRQNKRHATKATWRAQGRRS